MPRERHPAETWGRSLTQALRQIRRIRGLSTAEAARLMRMDRRNYAYFEAGKGRLNVARVLRFAEVTDSDPWALLGSVLMGAPALAVGAADNKLLLAFFILLSEFEAKRGAELSALETADAISAFGRAFAALEETLVDRRARLAADWLQAGAARIGLGSSPEVGDDDG